MHVSIMGKTGLTFSQLFMYVKRKHKTTGNWLRTRTSCIDRTVASSSLWIHVWHYTCHYIDVSVVRTHHDQKEPLPPLLKKMRRTNLLVAYRQIRLHLFSTTFKNKSWIFLFSSCIFHPNKNYSRKILSFSLHNVYTNSTCTTLA
jgi:hypothetical protein